MFGQSQQSVFGQSATTTAQSGGFTFGAPATATSGSIFGQPKTTASTGGFSFGQPAQSTTGSSGIFGTPTASSTGGTTSLFGTPTTTTSGGISFSGFNTPQTTASSTAASSIFGAPQTTANTGGFTFGQPAQPTTQATTGGLFGNTATAPNKSLFGAVTSTAAPSTGGLNFGQPTPVAAAFAQPATTTTSIFGQTAKPAEVPVPTQQQTAGGFAFGQAPTAAPASVGATSMFGQQAATTAPSGGFFGQTAPKSATNGGFTLGQNTTVAATTTAAPSIFGQTKTGLQQPTTTVITGGLFGTPTTVTATSNKGIFATPTTANAAPSAATAPFSFGQAPTTQLGALLTNTPKSEPGTGFAAPNISVASVKPTPISSFGFPTAVTTQPATVPAPIPTTTKSGFSLNAGAITTAATTAPTDGGFGFAAQPAAPVTQAATTTSTAAVAPFSLSTTTAVPASTASSTTFGSFAVPATTTVTPSNATVATTGIFSTPTLNSSTLKKTAAPTGTTSLTLTLPATTAAATTSAATTAAAAAAQTAQQPASKPLSFGEMENVVNRWVLDLEEQERAFMTQATQVNAWDRVLRENGEKIMSFYGELERVENDVEHTEHDLDFVSQQQEEMDQILTQLETTLASDDLSAVANLSTHSDLQREYILQLQLNLDSQLKQMGGDLSSLVERVNAVTRGDDGTETSGNIQQLAAILGKQMDSLQWIEHNTELIEQKVGELGTEVDNRRKEADKHVNYG